jgi:peptidoglycan hydrolase-like protein with peptidoglycan-binding domain
LQKALKADKFYDGPLDGIFGGGTGNACYRAKYRFGYPDSQLNRCGGQTLLNYLTGAVDLPADYKARRAKRLQQHDARTEIRNKMVNYMKWSIQNENSIHYAQVRPMDHLHEPQRLPWWTDCSEYVTTIYCWAGAPDPNGQNYNGYGYTGSLLDHGISIMAYAAQPGDVVIWGRWPGHHTAMVYSNEDHHDPELASHGSEAGPRLISLSEETIAQERYGAGYYTIKRYL